MIDDEQTLSLDDLEFGNFEDAAPSEEQPVKKTEKAVQDPDPKTEETKDEEHGDDLQVDKDGALEDGKKTDDDTPPEPQTPNEDAEFYVQLEKDSEKEPIKYKDLEEAYRKRYFAQKDYTQKTQQLAEQRRDMQAKEQYIRDEYSKFYKDPNYLLEQLKAYAPNVLLEAMQIYGTEYYDLMQLRENDLAEYHRRMAQEEDRVKNIKTQKAEHYKKTMETQKSQAEANQKFIEFVKIEGNNALKEAKLTNGDVDGKIWSYYISYLRNNYGTIPITKEILANAAKEISRDSMVKAYVATQDKRKPKEKEKLVKVSDPIQKTPKKKKASEKEEVDYYDFQSQLLGLD